MMKHSKLVLALGASLALGLAACGDDDDDTPSKVECTTSAECAANTDGRTQCDLSINKCVVPECNTSADCADNVDGKTDCNPSTHTCVLPSKDCSKDEECDSQLCGADSKCATTKSVDCKDAPPAHAESASTDVKVTVNFVDGAWEEAAVCPWYCTNGYQKTEDKAGCEELPTCTVETQEADCRSKICGADGKCATTKQDKCNAYTADELAARHATAQDSEALVEHTYVENPDGSAGWVADGHCEITACEANYAINEAMDACIAEGEVENCSKDDDCKGNATKIKCDTWSDSSGKGVCFVPECTQRSDCGADQYCEESRWTCASGCVYDSDCAGNTDGRTICDSLRGNDSTWECIVPDCVVSEKECSEKGEYCLDGHWAECATGKACATEGALKGTCQVPVSDECSPACSEGQTCKTYTDNSSNVTHVCEYDASQKDDIGIKINQFYFGGFQCTNNWAYNHQFIELYNSTSKEVDLSTLKIIKGNKKGSFELWTDLADACAEKDCKLGAGKYFIVVNKSVNCDSSANIVSGNVTISSTKPAIDGSLAVVSTQETDISSWDCNKVKKNASDVLGMNGAFCAEGTPAVGVPCDDENNCDTSKVGNREAKSFQRTNNADSGDNYYDFEAKAASIAH